ncbi:MAG: hypothetical protein ACRDTE_01225 [Pseudonocardiaceae bacterium]
MRELADGAEIVNPFRIPRMTPNSYQPLRPWDVAEHLDYYVGVDKTEDAFREFELQTRNPESLVADGRLVVVLGGQGCGKTSLIHRCTASVCGTLRTLKVTPVIVNLTREGMLNHAIPARMSDVCSGLIDQLDIDQRLNRSILEELKSRKDSPVDVYSYLSKVLQRQANNGDDLVVVVLLPPSDLVEEIINYARLVRPRLLFFAESSFVNEHSGWQSRLGSSCVPPIRLAVGILEPDDGFLFADTRLESHRGDGITPSVSEATMDELQKKRPALTIGQLQRLLCGVYGELLKQPTPVPEVTVQHFKDYYFNPGLD